MINQLNIPQLYYRYGHTKDEEIRKHLSVIKILDYYNQIINVSKILEKPREYSFIFDNPLRKESISNLTEFKTITFLVKSSSRFFLKPDLGEVFDQIEFNDIHFVKAIKIKEGWKALEGTEGEHFLMEAILLK